MCVMSDCVADGWLRSEPSIRQDENMKVYFIYHTSRGEMGKNQNSVTCLDWDFFYFAIGAVKKKDAHKYENFVYR